jgi:hypothetical protein
VGDRYESGVIPEARTSSRWVKSSQDELIIGLQAALLPKPYREAFGHVFDRAPSVSYEEVGGVRGVKATLIIGIPKRSRARTGGYLHDFLARTSRLSVDSTGPPGYTERWESGSCKGAKAGYRKANGMGSLLI